MTTARQRGPDEGISMQHVPNSLPPQPKAFPFARFEGSPEDIGLAHGRTFGEQIHRSISLQKRRTNASGSNYEAAMTWADAARNILRANDPELAQEIEAIARGAEVRPSEILALNMAVTLARMTIPAPTSDHAECTTAAILPSATASGDTIMAQNWDQATEQQQNMVVIEQHSPNRPALLFVTTAGRLFLHGMNSAGVGIVGNSLSCDRQTQAERTPMVGGIPGARRRALRQVTAKAAYDSLIGTPSGTSGNHIVADATGVAMDLECIPDGAYTLYPEQGLLTHANHYIHPEAKLALRDRNLEKFSDSLTRETRLRAGLEKKLGQIGIDDVKAALADHVGFPVSVCSHQHISPSGEVAQTVASSILDLNHRRLFVAPGPVCTGSYTEYRFAEM